MNNVLGWYQEDYLDMTKNYCQALLTINQTNDQPTCILKQTHTHYMTIW